MKPLLVGVGLGVVCLAASASSASAARAPTYVERATIMDAFNPPCTVPSAVRVDLLRLAACG